MATKFVKNLVKGNEGILENRATMIAEQAKLEQQTLVNNLKRDVLNIQGRIDRLSDLAPNTTVDLRPGGENFNATSWVNQLHNLQVELLNKNIELEIAEATMKTWFAEETA